MNELTLFMIILGCKPEGRFTEQHDVFFGIGNSLKELVPQMKASWPEAKGRIHIDAWRAITQTDGYNISITERNTNAAPNGPKLFFINLGGYKPGELEEFHYKVITAAADKGEAIKRSKQTAFYKHFGFAGAESHVDDKYGIDVDDLYQIEDILAPETKNKYAIRLTKAAAITTDTLHIGYLTMDKLEKSTL